jgi:hypothetical protein
MLFFLTEMHVKRSCVKQYNWGNIYQILSGNDKLQSNQDPYESIHTPYKYYYKTEVVAQGSSRSWVYSPVLQRKKKTIIKRFAVFCFFSGI